MLAIGTLVAGPPPTPAQAAPSGQPPAVDDTNRRPSTPGAGAPRGAIHGPTAGLVALLGFALLLMWVARHGLKFGAKVSASASGAA